MTEADALKVCKAAVAAWLQELTGWLRFKKVSHLGLDTPKARNKIVHRFGDSAQSSAVARKRPQRKKRNKAPQGPWPKKRRRSGGADLL